MKKVMVVDDSQLWLDQASKLLTAPEYEMNQFLVTDPQKATEEIPVLLRKQLASVNLLVVDKDIGQGYESTRLICLIRADFPALPIIRWTGGYENTDYMEYLGVSKLEKPSRQTETKFVAALEKALDEQKLILSGPSGIFKVVDAKAKVSERDGESRKRRLLQLEQIAELSDKDEVSMLDENGKREYDSYRGRYRTWSVSGDAMETTLHELGHCICDGELTAADIKPHLAKLQKLVEKLEANGGIDNRFRITADFITAGKLEELELVHRCY